MLTMVDPLDGPSPPESVDDVAALHLKSSPDTFLAALDSNSSHSAAAPRPPSLSEPDAVVEELTVCNYRTPTPADASLGDSVRESDSSARCLFPPPPPSSYTQLEAIRTAAFGFPQLASPAAALKGKGVATRRFPPGAAAANRDQGVRAADSGMGHKGARVRSISDGSNMREWISGMHRKSSRDERVTVFKRIVGIVEAWHSKGLILRHLRPSHFKILPSNRVEYIGALCPADQVIKQVASNTTSQRKRHLEHDHESNANAARKQLKLGEHSRGSAHSGFRARADNGEDAVGGIYLDTSKAMSPEFGNWEQLKHGESYYSSKFRNLPASGSCHLSKSEFERVEEMWYASPEELKEGVYSFSSNIYNLGVLLFELFCFSEAWEVHSTAMSDLRQRILPPNFLSDCPKEASLSLLLLHPEPSSRPMSKDILSCGLICEGRDLSSLGQSSTSVDEEATEAILLLHFLQTSKEQKSKQIAKLESELSCLDVDIGEIEKRQLSRTKVLRPARDLLTDLNGISDICHKGPMTVELPYRLPLSNKNEDKFIRNIDQLENAYFSMRSKIEPSEIDAVPRSDKEVLKIRDKCSQVRNDADMWKDSTDNLGDFFEGLCKYARYSRFEVRGGIRNVDNLNSTNVICSLSFDRDEEYFAAAGVSKKIKIFEFSSILNDCADIHYPLTEMSNRSKLSCVSWNSYIKNYLASTDYDGVVQLWDASTGQGLTQYAEHKRRTWSVDFSVADPTKLASGSDDCSVKLWSINDSKCLETIRNKANVCCVQFSPHSSHLLAFGSADSKIYCYDLRYASIPWCTLSGHRKTISYVKFVDSVTVVSASTDNTLKLWDLNKSDSAGLSNDACTTTFSDHMNEKNFVGLSVSDGYIACGSETNEVYAYYKTLPMSITSHKFDSLDPITGKETTDDNAQFVSSACWRRKSNMIIAANSSGSIKLLQLV